MRSVMSLIVIVGCCLLVQEAVFAAPAPANLFREGVPDTELGKKSALAQLPDFSVLAKTLSSSVVNISVESASQISTDAEEGQEIPFPFKQEPDAPARSTGSGFIISPDGFIATSCHVVDKSEKVIVRLMDDKTEYPAKIVGKDPKTDIALLKINPARPLTAVYVGDSDVVEVGQWAIAIGNQFELGQTVTLGIVSAKSRRVPGGGGPYDTFIQTDASINPGSSGGPLVNTKGQVIGINTAIFTPGRRGMNETGFNIGIGFAVPINLAKRILPELMNKGKITRGMLGVIIQQVDSDVAQALSLPSAEGALVSEVIHGSPAEKAGFKRKDVILSYNKKKIEDYNQLPVLVADTDVGTAVDVDIIRQGQKQTVHVVIDEIKDTKPRKKVEVLFIESLGMSLKERYPSAHKDKQNGSIVEVFVDKVIPGSKSERIGFMPKDRILEVADKPVTSSESLKEIVATLPKNKAVLVLVKRKMGTRYLTLKME